MKGEEDAEKKESNAMERYTRLVQFFSSPDKSLGELYPFSPYTSKIPLTECSTPVDEQSLSGSDDDFSGSDFSGSQASSANEAPINRNFLLDEPPARLHLKRRPKRKAQQEESKDSRQTPTVNQCKPCPDLKSTSWSSNIELQKGETPAADGKRGNADNAGGDTEQPQRPPSRRRENGEGSRHRSQDRASPENRKRRRSPEVVVSSAKGSPKAHSTSNARSRQAVTADHRTAADASLRKSAELSIRSTTENIAPLSRDEHHTSSQQTPRKTEQNHRSRETSQKRSNEPSQRNPHGGQRETPEAPHRTGRAPHRISSKSPNLSATDQTSRKTSVEFHQISSDAIRVPETSRSNTNRHRSSEAHLSRSEAPCRTPESRSLKVEAPLRTEGTVQRRTTTDVSHFDSCITPSGNERIELNREKRQHTSHSAHRNKRITSPPEQSYPTVIKSQNSSRSETSADVSHRCRRGSSVKSPTRLLEDSSQMSRVISRPASPSQMPTTPTPKTSSAAHGRSPIKPHMHSRAISPGKQDSPVWSQFDTPEESHEEFTQISPVESPLAVSTVSYHRKDVAPSSQRATDKGTILNADRQSKRKTRDHVENISTAMGDCASKPTSIHVKNTREASRKQANESSRRNEKVPLLSDKGAKQTSHINSHSITTEHTNEENEPKQFTAQIPKKSTPPSRSPRTTHEVGPKPTMPTIEESKVSQCGSEFSSIFERADYNAPKWSVQVSPSWRSSSGSDITEGDSILDIEKFKQTIRSVEVPPELLEPLEESEESDNLLNILETISESPLEDCSEIQNSHNEDDDCESAEDVIQDRPSDIDTLRRIARESTIGEQIETSGSDLSDIQLHYAYGRNKSNDQLELQWIKLEKIVDSASESSDGSAIESPFTRLVAEDLEIRSVNLPNASTAQRHGDADRGPIATYLTLPTQSPATIEDPELAIIVLREDNLSERQREVISRFRSGMQHHRPRSPSNEVSEDVFGDQLSRERSSHPLIIPIADPNGQMGSTTGFAVIADSEPEVPLSVDVDVKSWLTKQKMEEADPLILVNRCNSRPLELFRTISSETRLLTNNRENSSEREPKLATLHEWKGQDSESSISKSLQDDDVQNSASNVADRKTRASSARYSSNDRESSKQPHYLERPKTAPSSNDSSKLRCGETYRDKQKLSSVRESQHKRSTSFKRATDNSPEQRKIIPHNEMFTASTSSKSSAYYEKHSPPEIRTEGEHSRIPSGRRGIPNNKDNTVRVLLEPKTKVLKPLNEESRPPRKYDTDKRNNKSRDKDAESSSINNRPQKDTYKSCYRTDRNASPDREKPQERSKADPPNATREKSQDPSEKKPTKETTKTNSKRAQKRSLSACTSITSDVSNNSDLRQVESNISVSSQRSSRNSRKSSVAESHVIPKRPQTAPQRSENAIETLPMCDSCESTASTDSQGLPRYRLKRNIAYLSEYRKTIDSLRAKCVMKDHMIDALLEELQRLSPSDETYKRLLMRLSNRRIDGPPPRRDYSCSDVVDLLPSREQGAGEVLHETERSIPTDSSECKCVCPSDFRIAGRVGCDCLLLTWKSAAQYQTVAGYQVDVDGQLSQHVRSPTRTSALVMDLDLTREMRFTLRTLRHGGFRACHPPLEIIFAPSRDNWALDDPTRGSAVAP